jgi:hypothetical protein
MRHILTRVISNAGHVRRLTIGLVIVLAPCSAGAAADPVQPTRPPASLPQFAVPSTVQSPAIPEEVEAGHTILDGMVECDKMAARLLEMKKLAANLEKVSGFLDKLGTVMTSYSIAKHSNEFVQKGEVDGLVDDAQGLVISEGGCAAAGIFCPVYKAGMGVGTFISYAPKVFGWTDETLNDMWTGFWADVTTGTTKYQLDRKIGEFRTKIEQAKRDAANAEARNAQCKAAPRATAVDELLDKSKAPQALSRSGNSGRELIAKASNEAAAWEAGRPARELAEQQQQLRAEQQWKASVAAIQPAPVVQRPQQQPRSSSGSGFNWGAALGAVLQGYAAGRSSRASSSPRSTVQPSQDDCSASTLPAGGVCTAN